FERGDRVERVRSPAAAAMPHAGHHEKTGPVGLVLAQLVQDAFVVENGILWRDSGVAPSGIEEQLTAVRLERLEIGIHSVDESNLLVDDRHVAIEVEAVPVVIRILKRPDTNGVGHLSRRRAAQWG